MDRGLKLKETIIFTNGCFDLLHIGHLEILKYSKSLGDKLYVAINSDESVRKLKGNSRPIIPQQQRFEIVSSIKYVDKVFIFDEETPLKLIELIKPDIIVKGGDYLSSSVIGGHIAKVVIVPLLPNISTSKIIERIKNG